MYTTKGQTIYPASSEYNLIRVLNALDRLVTSKGGKVFRDHHYYIVNRTLTGAIREEKEKIQRAAENLKNLSDTGERINRRANLIEYIAERQKELHEMESIKNNPLRVHQSTYIKFSFDGFYYYYQVDENPFFPFLGTPKLYG